jgi:hypothetical protein
LFAVVPKQFRLQILHASMFLFLVSFLILATPKKPVQQIQRLFVGKEEKGPKLPHYEEEKLKSPYLDNRF